MVPFVTASLKCVSRARPSLRPGSRLAVNRRHQHRQDRVLDRTVGPALLDVRLGQDRVAVDEDLRIIGDLALHEGPAELERIVDLVCARFVRHLHEIRGRRQDWVNREGRSVAGDRTTGVADHTDATGTSSRRAAEGGPGSRHVSHVEVVHGCGGGVDLVHVVDVPLGAVDSGEGFRITHGVDSVVDVATEADGAAGIGVLKPADETVAGVESLLGQAVAGIVCGPARTAGRIKSMRNRRLPGLAGPYERLGNQPAAGQRTAGRRYVRSDPARSADPVPAGRQGPAGVRQEPAQADPGTTGPGRAGDPDDGPVPALRRLDDGTPGDRHRRQYRQAVCHLRPDSGCGHRRGNGQTPTVPAGKSRPGAATQAIRRRRPGVPFPPHRTMRRDHRPPEPEGPRWRILHALREMNDRGK